MLKSKKIEFLHVELTSEEGHKFEDILKSSEVEGREFAVRGKSVSFNIHEQTSQYIIGIVETGRKDNIPPKRNSSNRRIDRIGLTPDEGLAYANILMYVKNIKVLLYEVNKNGCYVDHFLEYIYKCSKQEESTLGLLDINLGPVLKSGSYERIMEMGVQKSLEFTVANPTVILDAHSQMNDSLKMYLNNAKAMHSNKMNIKLDVSMQGKARFESRGLLHTPVERILRSLLQIRRGPKGENIKKVEVTGYEQDSEDNKAITIDLLTERFIDYIKLDEPRENIDLLEEQRVSQIKTLYQKCKPALLRILADS